MDAVHAVPDSRATFAGRSHDENGNAIGDRLAPDELQRDDKLALFIRRSLNTPQSIPIASLIVGECPGDRRLFGTLWA